MRWWGWGDPAHPPALAPHALSHLARTLGDVGPPRPPVALANVRLPEARLAATTLQRLHALLGQDAVRDDHAARVMHAAGKGYPDLVRLRAGEPDGAPDAVLLPGSPEQVRAVLELCAAESVAVVPFGGGTSVVGGLAPLRGGHAAVVTLDLARLDGVLRLDRESNTVAVQGGIRAPALERALAEHGLTLGHHPQSYEHVSLGGCAATRSAGQASSGYGAIDKMILGLRLTSPSGEVALPAVPATAAGPGLRGTIVGSEGTLGVITELALRVRAAPPEKAYEGVFFEDFEGGVRALREMAQEHALADVARLSDAPETATSMAFAGGGGIKGLIGRAYLGARGRSRGCLAVLGFEGAGEQVTARRDRALALARAHGGLPVGASPGQAWLRSRYQAPYLRDDLLTHGLLVETLETATQWSNLHVLHERVGVAIAGALASRGSPALVMCHVSHVYETGASLYFTFLARQEERDPIAQWRAVKDAAGEAIVCGGGTITHHHAVGRDHAPWLARELGGGLRALQALKDELDPQGIMNPGKLALSPPAGLAEGPAAVSR